MEGRRDFHGEQNLFEQEMVSRLIGEKEWRGLIERVEGEEWGGLRRAEKG